MKINFTFDEKSQNFDRNRKINIGFIKMQERFFNVLKKKKGFITLQDVIERFGYSVEDNKFKNIFRIMSSSSGWIDGHSPEIKLCVNENGFNPRVKIILDVPEIDEPFWLMESD